MPTMADYPEVRLLSLWQPWATLLAIQEKGAETRSFTVSYRGWVAIHAAKHWDLDSEDTCLSAPFSAVLTSHGYTYRPTKSGPARFGLPAGGIIAVSWINGSFRSNGSIPKSYLFPQHERAFGDWQAGRGIITFDHSLTKKLPELVPYRANQVVLRRIDDVAVLGQLAKYLR